MRISYDESDFMLKVDGRNEYETSIREAISDIGTVLFG